MAWNLIYLLLKIIELRSNLEYNSELENLLKLKVKYIRSGQIYDISLDKYYYTVNDYISLYRYIKSFKFSHIMCIDGAIKRFFSTNKCIRSGMLQLYAPYVKHIHTETIPYLSYTFRFRMKRPQKIYAWIKIH
jgi:hypothetical protein